MSTVAIVLQILLGLTAGGTMVPVVLMLLSI